VRIVDAGEDRGWMRIVVMMMMMMMVVVMMGDGYLVHGDSFQEGLTKTIFR